MKVTIEIIAAKILVGKRNRATIANDVPASYWRPFKMNLKEIQNALSDKFYSVQTFDGVDFQKFTTETQFDKWAAVEVSEIGHIPEGLEVIHIPKGKYAAPNDAYKGPRR